MPVSESFWQDKKDLAIWHQVVGLRRPPHPLMEKIPTLSRFFYRRASLNLLNNMSLCKQKFLRKQESRNGPVKLNTTSWLLVLEIKLGKREVEASMVQWSEWNRKSKNRFNWVAVSAAQPNLQLTNTNTDENTNTNTDKIHYWRSEKVSLADNLKARDASASKTRLNWSTVSTF